MLLELNEVSKSFGGVAALTGISFGVKQGEVFGVVGRRRNTCFAACGVFPINVNAI